MAGFSIQLPDELLLAADQYAADLRLSRAEYIRMAIDHFYRETQRRVHGRRMAVASDRVRAESMRVNAEFAAFESAPDR